MYFVIRSETHFEDLLKEYQRREEENIETEILVENSEEKSGRKKKPRSAYLVKSSDAYYKIDDLMWEEWHKQFQHPGLESKHFRNPAFDSNKKVSIFLYYFLCHYVLSLNMKELGGPSFGERPNGGIRKRVRN